MGHGEEGLKFINRYIFYSSLLISSIAFNTFFQGKYLCVAIAQDNLTQIVPDHPPTHPFELTLRKALEIALRTYPGL